MACLLWKHLSWNKNLITLEIWSIILLQRWVLCGKDEIGHNKLNITFSHHMFSKNVCYKFIKFVDLKKRLFDLLCRQWLDILPLSDLDPIPMYIMTWTLSHNQQIYGRWLWKHLFKMVKIFLTESVKFKVENILQKGEFAHYKRFVLLSQCFN